MKKILYPLIIAALVSVAGCGDSFYAAYDDMTGPVESVYLPETATVIKGNTIKLDAEVYPSLTANKNVTWSATAGVTVDQNGVVTGDTVGTATVTVTTEEGGFTATCTVTVETSTIPGAPAVTLAEETHQITATWDAVSDATAYEVWYMINTGGDYTCAAADVSGTSYSLTGLTTGSTYHVRVKAKNSAGTSAYSDDATQRVGYALGDTGPAGGWIFYIASSVQIDATNGNWKYMEAAPADCTASVWGTYNISISGADGTAIGTGLQNTLDIVSGDSLSTTAADRCADYSVTHNSVTYTDWFLPSKDELYQMWTNLFFVNSWSNIGGFASGNWYWSSSEYNSYYSCRQSFPSGASTSQSTLDKNISYQIRAARRFL